MQNFWWRENKDYPSLENIRPITILPAVVKFFENTILHNLEKITNSNEFSNYQRGFTKNKSTLDNIKDILTEARNPKEKKKKETLTLVFFDFSKAYDTISLPILIEKLKRFNMSRNYIKLIKNMQYNFKFKIGKEIIVIKRDLIQGSVLSPLLFNIYLTDLLKEYEDNKIYEIAY